MEIESDFPLADPVMGESKSSQGRMIHKKQHFRNSSSLTSAKDVNKPPVHALPESTEAYADEVKLANAKRGSKTQLHGMSLQKAKRQKAKKGSTKSTGRAQRNKPATGTITDTVEATETWGTTHRTKIDVNTEDGHLMHHIQIKQNKSFTDVQINSTPGRNVNSKSAALHEMEMDS